MKRCKNIMLHKIIELLDRNHTLFSIIKLYERLTLALIRDDDNSLQRNKKAVEYIDKEIKKTLNDDCKNELKKIRNILTKYETNDLLQEISSTEKKGVKK